MGRRKEGKNNYLSFSLRRCVSASLRLFFTLFLFTSCCHEKSNVLQPCIVYTPPEKFLQKMKSPFPPLNEEERQSTWGTEVIVGDNFARKLDLYRAITCYKRGEVLLPPNNIERLREIQYKILCCYFLGRQFGSAVEIFEFGALREAPQSFPALRSLLIMLYEAYRQIGMNDKAVQILTYLDNIDPEAARRLQLGAAITEGQIDCAEIFAEEVPEHEEITFRLESYRSEALSIKKAQTLNALLPGAGYYYVGQKSTAFTSFTINALFSIAAWQLFRDNQIALGIIVTSLESGWYLGGINGAGLAAKKYNEDLYNKQAKEIMLDYRLFPALQFTYAF